MSKRNDAQPDINEKSEDQARPQKPDPEPDKMEGPGGQREAKAEEDARNKAARRGER